MNFIAFGVIALNIAVAIGLYYALNGRIEFPMMVGILSGAVTNTPGLGAAQEALSQLQANGQIADIPQIALGYAVAYPLGVVGIILSMILVRIIFRVNMEKENEALNSNTDSVQTKPHLMHLEVHNEAIFGKKNRRCRCFI